MNRSCYAHPETAKISKNGFVTHDFARFFLPNLRVMHNFFFLYLLAPINHGSRCDFLCYFASGTYRVFFIGKYLRTADYICKSKFTSLVTYCISLVKLGF